MKSAKQHLKNWINEWFNSEAFTTDDLNMNERIQFIETMDHTKFNYETGEWDQLIHPLPEHYTFHMCYDDKGCYVSVVDENGSDQWGCNAIERGHIASLIKKFGFSAESLNIFHIPYELSCEHVPLLLKALGFKHGANIQVDRDIAHG